MPCACEEARPPQTGSELEDSGTRRETAGVDVRATHTTSSGWKNANKGSFGRGSGHTGPNVHIPRHGLLQNMKSNKCVQNVPGGLVASHAKLGRMINSGTSAGNGAITVSRKVVSDSFNLATT